MQNNYKETYKQQDNVFRFWHIIFILLRIISIILSTAFLGYIECKITGKDRIFFAYLFPIFYFVLYFIDNNLKTDFYHRHYYWDEKKR